MHPNEYGRHMGEKEQEYNSSAFKQKVASCVTSVIFAFCLLIGKKTTT